MRQLDISYPTIEFTKLVKSWDGYRSDKMGIILRHVKAKELPFFVKPSSPKKASGNGTKLAKGGKSLKRATSEKVRQETQKKTAHTSCEPCLITDPLFSSKTSRRAKNLWQTWTIHPLKGYDPMVVTLTFQEVCLWMIHMAARQRHHQIRQLRHLWQPPRHRTELRPHQRLL